MADSSKKIWAYSDSYIDFGFHFVVDKGVHKPQCVVCLEILANSSLKPSKLRRHLEKNHPAFNVNPNKADIFRRKRETLKRSRLDETGDVGKLGSAILLASFKLSWNIVRAKKPHTIGESLIKPCLKDAVSLLVGEDAAKKVGQIPLSDNTVCRRIGDMAENLNEQIVARVKSSSWHALALDESTDVSSCAQLLVYVRYIHDDDIEEDFFMCIKTWRPEREVLMSSTNYKVSTKHQEWT